jgi:hypothetical protein
MEPIEIENFIKYPHGFTRGDINFYPISQIRPLWDLICGTFSFKKRILDFLKALEDMMKRRAGTLTIALSDLLISLYSQKGN